MKRSLYVLFLSVFFVVSGFAQQAKSSPPPATISNDGKWEYLVVSFGKNSWDVVDFRYFWVESKTKYIQSLRNEYLHETKELVQNLDKIGEQGWELVTIVGLIGGDQQLVFKRKFDSVRSKKEKDAYDLDVANRRKEEEKAQAELEKFQQKLLKDQAAGIALIDIDAVEQAKNEAAIAKEKSEKETAEKNDKDSQKEAVSVAIQDVIKDKYKVAAYNSEIQYYLGSIDIEIIIDASSMLREKNKYRSSEIDQLIVDVENILREMSFESSLDIVVTIKCIINLKGKPNDVGSDVFSGTLNEDGYRNWKSKKNSSKEEE